MLTMISGVHWSERAVAAALADTGTVAGGFPVNGRHLSFGDDPTTLGLTYETVDWSQARYDDYGFIALDVTPAARGRKTTMVLRFVNEQGLELDRVVFSRIAGA
jgi:hypothetical protein